MREHRPERTQRSRRQLFALIAAVVSCALLGPLGPAAPDALADGHRPGARGDGPGRPDRPDRPGRTDGRNDRLQIVGDMVLPRDGTTPADAASRVAGEHRVLVIRAHFGRHPARPSASDVRQQFARSGRELEGLSAGRFGLRRAAVTPWIRIRQIRSCGWAVDRKHAEAVRKARARGVAVGRFDHVVLYLPCSDPAMAGLADLSGSRVWLFDSLTPGVIVHELLHNLGVGHANLYRCRQDGRSVSFAGRCDEVEYGDAHDVMGSGGFQLNAAMRDWLGWLDGERVTRGDTEVTLHPLGGEEGPQTLRVAGIRDSYYGRLDYWIDLRSEEPAGVVVHVGSTLVDAVPSHRDDTLPVGSSVTLRNGVRITLLSSDGETARVAVDVGARTARAPAPPSDVTADGGPYSATVSWERPDDRGAPIHAYVVTASPGDHTKVVRTAGGLTTSAVVKGLDAGTTYSFEVRALNQVGSSGAGRTVEPVTPDRLGAVARIWSPWDGEQLYGGARPEVTIQRDPEDPLPVTQVEYLLDGAVVATATSAPWTVGDLWFGPDAGEHVLRTRTTDAGGAVRLSEPVTVDLVPLVVEMTSPAPGSVPTVDQSIRLAWQGTGLEHVYSATGCAVPEGEDEMGCWAYTDTGATELELPTWHFPEGPLTVLLILQTDGNYQHTVEIPVVVDHS